LRNALPRPEEISVPVRLDGVSHGADAGAQVISG
jgi:hypothetical protein